MINGYLYRLAFALSLQLYAVTAFAETHKFALVLGNNQGYDTQATLRYAEQDARKFYEVLIELGGFLPDDTVLLLNVDAARARQAFNQIEKRLAEYKQKSTDKTLLIIFYSGHAEGQSLELGGSSLPFSELSSFLRASSADVRIAFLDSCQSGQLIAAKGGHRAASFEIRVTDEITSKGYAMITSSAQNELSQESAELRGAYFTHYLVSALRGAGDFSGDGKVTLDEAYRYVYAHTLAHTAATVGGSQHPMYEFELHGRGEIVLTRFTPSSTRIAAKTSRAGRLILLNDAGDTIVAEAETAPHKTILVAVQPGSYRVYLLSPDGSAQIAKAEVISGRTVQLNSNDFHPVVLETAASKGGLFSSEPAPWTHRLSIGPLWRAWPLWGSFSSYGMTLLYRLQMLGPWESIVKLTWATRDDVGVSTGYHDIGLLVGLGYLFPVYWSTFRISTLGGYEQILQSDWNGKARYSSGFNYLGLIGAEISSSIFFISVDLGAGGRLFRVIDKGVVHRLDLQAFIGLGCKWNGGDSQ
jgi:hypothetical protein